MTDVISVNPARPSEVVATFPAATATDVDAAVARAKAAQSEWAAIPIPARAETIAAWHDAKKYRDLMAKQPGINKRAQAAPPPAVKATASGTANSMQKAKAQEVSGRLKKTGRTEDAAAVLLARMQKG